MRVDPNSAVRFSETRSVLRRRRVEFGYACHTQSQRGLTLVEMLISMSITAMLGVVLGGISLAVEQAWQHTTGIQDAEYQAGIALGRIQQMTHQMATYDVDSFGPVPGIAVVSRTWTYMTMPTTLVVWSGGHEGNLSTSSPYSRLPRWDELVVFTCLEDRPTEFVEVTFPNKSGEIDFRSSSFDAAILNALDSEDIEAVTLCDRMRIAELAGTVLSPDLTSGLVWFSLAKSPSDEELASVQPGTEAWANLRWYQGLSNDESGVRQISVRTELQVRTRLPRDPDLPNAYTVARDTSIPFFGSASTRYAYQP